MKNKFWKAIHEVYMKLERHCGKPSRMETAAMASEDGMMAEGGSMDEGDEMETVDAEELVSIRSDLRTQLDFLKATLAEQYSERDTYLILFPIVAQIDEVVLGHFLHKLHTGWPSLQKELFQIDNAGEVFYDILDDILLKPQTPQFIFEVYYFCLNYGFRGRHQDNPVKLRTYMKKLLGKLEQEQLETGMEDREENVVVSHKGSLFTSYLMAGGALVVVYFILLVAGRNIL